MRHIVADRVAWSVGRLVSWSVCLSVILMSPAKPAEAIDVLFVRAKDMPDNTLP